MQVLSTPQGMLPVHQPRPCHPATPYQQVVQPLSQPATPYQQAVQLLSRPVGRGGAAQLPSSSATPATSQLAQDCGRQQTRGHGIRGRSVSCPRHGWGTATNVPSTTTPGATQPQPAHPARPRHPDPALLANKYRSSGWRKDLEHVFKVYYKHNIQVPFKEPESVQVRELFFDHFIPKKDEALILKEESPLEYMPFIGEELYRATGICLHELPEFTLWSRGGVIFMGYWSREAKSRSAPT